MQNRGFPKRFLSGLVEIAEPWLMNSFFSGVARPITGLYAAVGEVGRPFDEGHFRNIFNQHGALQVNSLAADQPLLAQNVDGVGTVSLAFDAGDFEIGSDGLNVKDLDIQTPKTSALSVNKYFNTGSSIGDWFASQGIDALEDDLDVKKIRLLKLTTSDDFSQQDGKLAIRNKGEGRVPFFSTSGLDVAEDFAYASGTLTADGFSVNQVKYSLGDTGIPSVAYIFQSYQAHPEGSIDVESRQADASYRRLKVRVDGDTIKVNASNQLESSIGYADPLKIVNQEGENGGKEVGIQLDEQTITVSETGKLELKTTCQVPLRLVREGETSQVQLGVDEITLGVREEKLASIVAYENPLSITESKVSLRTDATLTVLEEALSVHLVPSLGILLEDKVKLSVNANLQAFTFDDEQLNLRRPSYSGLQVTSEGLSLNLNGRHAILIGEGTTDDKEISLLCSLSHFRFEGNELNLNLIAGTRVQIEGGNTISVTMDDVEDRLDEQADQIAKNAQDLITEAASLAAATSVVGATAGTALANSIGNTSAIGALAGTVAGLTTGLASTDAAAVASQLQNAAQFGTLQGEIAAIQSEIAASDIALQSQLGILEAGISTLTAATSANSTAIGLNTTGLAAVTLESSSTAVGLAATDTLLGTTTAVASANTAAISGLSVTTAGISSNLGILDGTVALHTANLGVIDSTLSSLGIGLVAAQGVADSALALATTADGIAVSAEAASVSNSASITAIWLALGATTVLSGIGQGLSSSNFQSQIDALDSRADYLESSVSSFWAANYASHTYVDTTFQKLLSVGGSGLTLSGSVLSLNPAQPTITSLGILTALTSTGPVSITSSTASTSIASGALVVKGGIGCGANLTTQSLSVVSNAGVSTAVTSLLAPGLLGGAKVELQIGRNAATGNLATIDFNYSSGNNNLGFGFYGSNNMVQLFPDGRFLLQGSQMITQNALNTILSGYVTSSALGTTLSAYAQTADLSNQYVGKNSSAVLQSLTVGNTFIDPQSASPSSIITNRGNAGFSFRSQDPNTLAYTTLLTVASNGLFIGETSKVATEDWVTSQLTPYVTTSQLGSYATNASLGDYQKALVVTAPLALNTTTNTLSVDTTTIATVSYVATQLSAYLQSTTAASIYSTPTSVSGQISTALQPYATTSSLSAYINSVGDNLNQSGQQVSLVSDPSVRSVQAWGGPDTFPHQGSYLLWNNLSPGYGRLEILNQHGGGLPEIDFYDCAPDQTKTLLCRMKPDGVYVNGTSRLAVEGLSYTKGESDGKFALQSSIANFITSSALTPYQLNLSAGQGVLISSSVISVDTSLIATQSFVTSQLSSYQTTSGMSNYLTTLSGSSLFQTKLSVSSPLVLNGSALSLNTANITSLACSGILSVSNVTEATSLTTGAVQVKGGISVTKQTYLGSTLFMTNVNGSNGTIRLSPNVAGGEVALGMYNDSTFNAGSNLWMIGRGSYGTGSSFCICNTLYGGPVMTVTTSGQTTINGTTDSTTPSSGIFQVKGGCGIAKNLYVGATIYQGTSPVVTQSSLANYVQYSGTETIITSNIEAGVPYTQSGPVDYALAIRGQEWTSTLQNPTGIYQYFQSPGGVASSWYSISTTQQEILLGGVWANQRYFGSSPNVVKLSRNGASFSIQCSNPSYFQSGAGGSQTIGGWITPFSIDLNMQTVSVSNNDIREYSIGIGRYSSPTIQPTLEFYSNGSSARTGWIAHELNMANTPPPTGNMLYSNVASYGGKSSIGVTYASSGIPTAYNVVNGHYFDGSMMVQGALALQGATNFNVQQGESAGAFGYTGYQGYAVAASSLPVSLLTMGSVVSNGMLLVLSDRRAKENIEYIPSDVALDIVRKLSARSFTMKSTGLKSLGWVAQECELFVPSAVKQIEDSKVLDHAQLSAVLWAAVKELSRKMSELEKKLLEL